VVSDVTSYHDAYLVGAAACVVAQGLAWFVRSSPRPEKRVPEKRRTWEAPSGRPGLTTR